jgi:hypothetical protein
MQMSLSIGAVAGVVALGLAACAQQSPPAIDTAALVQADTIYPPAPAPLKAADKVDWRNAARPPSDTNPNDPSSNFIRAQSLMAKLSSAAYEVQARFDSLMNPWGLVGNRITSGGGKWAADAYVGGSERLGLLFVAIRGTSNAADFLTDFLLAPTLSTTSGVQGTVHAGFALYEDSLYDQVRQTVDPSCNPNLVASQKVPLWVTGHSLGAAAAAIMAYRLKQDGCNVAGVSLFGAPRPGLSDFQAAYNASMPNITQRWTTEKDPVYCLPPGGAWRHVGTENTLSHGINVGTNTDESQCNSPEKMIGFIKAGLISLDVVSYGSNYMTQALLDWLKGLFDLGFSCPTDLQWDNTLSYAACSVTDFGYGTASIYGGLQPSEIFNAGLTLSMLRYHDISRYVAGLDANFDDPQPEWVKVRMIIPSEQLADTSIREEVYQGVCTPTPLDSTHGFCDFDAPVGGTIHLTSEEYWAPEAGACDRVGGGPGLDCELDISGPRTVVFDSGILL